MFTLRLLREIGILDRFQVVVSGDTLAQKKPHPAPLLYAAEQLLAPKQVMRIPNQVPEMLEY